MAQNLDIYLEFSFFFFFCCHSYKFLFSFVNKVTTKRLGSVWTEQSSTWFLCCLLTLFFLHVPLAALLPMSLASGSDKDPNDVIFVTQHFRGHHPCHLHTDKEYTRGKMEQQNKAGVRGGGDGKPQFPLKIQEYTDTCWKFWDLGCHFLHSAGISSGGHWALQKMLPDPRNSQFQYWNCQSKGEERRAREVNH